MNPSPSLPAGLTVIPKDIMAMALGIVSGQLRTVTITEDMVGRTISWTGEMHLVDIDPALLADMNRAAPIAAQAASVPAPATHLPGAPAVRKAGVRRSPASTPHAPSRAEGPDLRELIRTALQLDPGKCLSISQIGDLIETDTRCKSRRSLSAHLRQHLGSMAQGGQVETISNGKKAFYRLIEMRAA